MMIVSLLLYSIVGPKDCVAILLTQDLVIRVFFMIFVSLTLRKVQIQLDGNHNYNFSTVSLVLLHLPL